MHRQRAASLDEEDYIGSKIVDVVAQAIFLHDRLLAGALDEDELDELRDDLERWRKVVYQDEHAYISAYESVAARLLTRVRELGVAIVADDLASGELVALTQDFYFRRGDPRGSFKASLDSDRRITLHGNLTTARLIGVTGRSEASGHRRFTMLAYTGTIDLTTLKPAVELRPAFIGWLTLGGGPFAEHDDRREVWPQQIDQFSAIAGKRATAADRRAVSRMSEESVKTAFADIIGEPFVPKDWGGETSDLFTGRLTKGGKPLSASFAFKGPALKGTLHISGMGKRGDQALRLAHEPADLLVVQHHQSIAADVRNLLSAIARMHRRRWMAIDGETTAVILGVYGKLPSPPPSPGGDGG